MQFQVHYSDHHGEDVKDLTSIGLVFAREPVKHEVAQYEVWNNVFRIPPEAQPGAEVKVESVPDAVWLIRSRRG